MKTPIKTNSGIKFETISLRLPTNLSTQLQIMADSVEISVESLIRVFIAEKLGWPVLNKKSKDVT